ncbi:NUDIX hydrolase [Kineosporia succinea]|uniref:8-oxo-dGTP pyrophosphatase MutT (NUDIX family) n=1 Tax=Kineosporia succinea TaxID=84632 RepID=A0ABT9P017_9ACTN|nr:NUDIX domain-containing protein [Kineosporia succinea]MDP9825857.1 8-oxo-dGTP pyrophosphatase MutT (NUDIX family) [Kineosporia succinea]
MHADEELLRRARSLLAGELEPVRPRAAATVALLRDGAEGIEVYLLRRVPKMAFAAGMYVFPGGSVDAADAVPGDAWTGPSGDVWAGRLGTDVTTASTLVRAAVRETFEETGVLLASGDGSPTEPERADLEAGRLSLAALFARHRLTLRADLLAPLQHWITPELEPRRYDTWFFAAALPPGAQPREVGTEADRRVWITPARALESDLTLMAPTRAALTDLAGHATVASVLAADREITTVLPRFEIVDGRVVLIRP